MRAALLRIGIDPRHGRTEDQQRIAILHDPLAGLRPQMSDATCRRANHPADDMPRREVIAREGVGHR
jgi:hypothetical protein